MKPATWPRDEVANDRMLVLDPTTGALSDERVGDLPSHLRRGDVLVVNDAATLPASLSGRSQDGAAIEARLYALEGSVAKALLFGAGDYRTPTEDRPLPPRLVVGDALVLGALSARVTAVSEASARLVELTFDREGARLWQALYEAGRVVQYSYVKQPLALWHVQTRYASEPLSAEMPSAGRPLSWELLLALKQKGVIVARLSHAAGLSSTGDAAIDALLPMPERFTISVETAAIVRAAKREGRRVIAVGTSVVRALEGAFRLFGEVRGGAATTDLILSCADTPRVVDGLFTGMHEPSESHYDLLEAFVPKAFLARASEHADRQQYLKHELGDSTLVLAA
jgi:S-adenosylmethionine:tRNA ribosyltransferase-isomerase